MRTRWLLMGTLLVAGALPGCGDCLDEVAAANKFLEEPANLVCQSDDDCVVVQTGCAEPSRAFCGQAALNQSAASSTKWHQISDGLAECDSNCAQCDGALVPHCAEG